MNILKIYWLEESIKEALKMVLNPLKGVVLVLSLQMVAKPGF